MQDSNLAKYNLIKFLFPALIFALFIASFWAAFYKMSIRWEGGDSDYCYLVVPLFAYLLWDKRKKPAQSEEDEKLQNAENEGFRFGEFSWNIFGLVPILLSIALIMVGEFGSVETLMYIGIWGCVVGIAYLLYGRRIRQLLFPLLILAFIVPLPAFINRTLTFQLKLAASSLATLMLRLSGVSVFQDGNIIDLGVTQLQVVDACSGLRYLMPLLLLGLLIGYFFSKGLWRRAVVAFFRAAGICFPECFQDLGNRHFDRQRAWRTGGKSVS